MQPMNSTGTDTSTPVFGTVSTRSKDSNNWKVLEGRPKCTRRTFGCPIQVANETPCRPADADANAKPIAPRRCRCSAPCDSLPADSACGPVARQRAVSSPISPALPGPLRSAKRHVYAGKSKYASVPAGRYPQKRKLHHPHIPSSMESSSPLFCKTSNPLSLVSPCALTLVQTHHHRHKPLLISKLLPKPLRGILSGNFAHPHTIEQTLRRIVRLNENRRVFRIQSFS